MSKSAGLLQASASLYGTEKREPDTLQKHYDPVFLLVDFFALFISPPRQVSLLLRMALEYADMLPFVLSERKKTRQNVCLALAVSGCFPGPIENILSLTLTVSLVRINASFKRGKIPNWK